MVLGIILISTFPPHTHNVGSLRVHIWTEQDMGEAEKILRGTRCYQVLFEISCCLKTAEGELLFFPPQRVTNLYLLYLFNLSGT